MNKMIFISNRKPEHQLMEDFDSDLIGEKFCNKKGCSCCDGSDMNGEPNGYGCPEQEKHIEKSYNRILKIRRKKEAKNDS